MGVESVPDIHLGAELFSVPGARKAVHAGAHTDVYTHLCSVFFLSLPCSSAFPHLYGGWSRHASHLPALGKELGGGRMSSGTCW